MCNVDLSALHDKKKTNGTAELLVLGPNGGFYELICAQINTLIHLNLTYASC